MLDSQYQQLSVKPEVFSRTSLQFTVKLIKPYNPALALKVQNFLGDSHSFRENLSDPPQATDLFEISVDSPTLKQVVETVAKAGGDMAQQVLAGNNIGPGKLVQTKAIIDKWLLFAKQRMDDSERQKPLNNSANL